jgi:hypothetical protein
MDIVNIQALIAQNRSVSITDIDTRNTYIQLGVFQTGNRPSGSSNADTYSPYVISIDNLLASVIPPVPVDSSVVFLTTTIDLSYGLDQVLAFPTIGTYIVDSVIVTSPNADLSSEGIMNLTLTLPGNTGATFETALIGPPASDLLNNLFVLDNYIYMESNTPPCFPPPCNGSFIYDGSITTPMTFKVATPNIASIKIVVYVKLLRIA